jgi:hypothetical protein
MRVKPIGPVLLIVGAALFPIQGATSDAEATGAAPLTWATCLDQQIRVMILGTFHFDQTKAVNVLDAERQAELDGILTELEVFAPELVAVEYPWAKQERLDESYRTFMESPDPSALRSKNEIYQLGFRLARRLDLPSVAAVDVPMNLWDEAIGEYDERYPKSRKQLRKRWKVDISPRIRPDDGQRLAEMLIRFNRDLPPGNEELYGGFLPLVVDEMYVGALKLRPWYDRNLRIVQNLFRHADPEMDRIVLVVGASHVRVLKQIMEMTPQLCPVDPVPFLEKAERARSAGDTSPASAAGGGS